VVEPGAAPRRRREPLWPLVVLGIVAIVGVIALLNIFDIPPFETESADVGQPDTQVEQRDADASPEIEVETDVEETGS
jgi:hypothetical protein